MPADSSNSVYPSEAKERTERDAPIEAPAIISFAVIALAIIASLPRYRLLEFNAGQTCYTAVGSKMCPNNGNSICGKSYEKCNLGTNVIATSCSDGVGTDSSCKNNPDCIHIKNASYNTNCTPPGGGNSSPPESQ